MYRMKRNWQGDPCAPKDYSWDGLSCSYNAFDSPSIISFLFISGIYQTITYIELFPFFCHSCNSCEFCKLLRIQLTLNLQNNNLSGSIPMELIERSNKGSLLLSVGGNPNLASIGGNPNPCVLSPCKKKKNIVVPVAAAAVGFFILLLCGLALFWQLKRTKKGRIFSKRFNGLDFTRISYASNCHDLNKNSSFLSWETRLKITMDSAQGLEYLPNGCKPPIIHRDIKSISILLDENFQDKLADLGLSRSIPNVGGTHV
ncbi:putative leucine-rich repeat receptor-like serine/threonine-protein kinase [Quercus suber]|uniref:Leucine-rich repeat receptor-like serine/threonine-protein kinase n=1 Tax=Quercus suber TaxID=58331 RepID=A0AAW0KFV0_QUESU